MLSNALSKASFVLMLGCLLAETASSRSEIYRWDNRLVIPGTEGIHLGPGVRLNGRQLEYADLSGINLSESRFDEADLSYASLAFSRLENSTAASTREACL